MPPHRILTTASPAMQFATKLAREPRSPPGRASLLQIREARYNLGVIYERGDDVPQNYVEAVR
jgi:TPR repeat protein